MASCLARSPHPRGSTRRPTAARVVIEGLADFKAPGGPREIPCKQRPDRYPPIWDMERLALTKPGSLILCLSSLWATAKRISSSSRSSEEPSRSGVFRSHSRREKRQVRSCPSAVSLIRSHVEQNGSETGLTNPISPAPSAKRKRRAVDEGFAGSSSSGQRSSISARISPPVRSEEHTSELQSHGLISYAVFCL